MSIFNRFFKGVQQEIKQTGFFSKDRHRTTTIMRKTDDSQFSQDLTEDKGYYYLKYKVFERIRSGIPVVNRSIQFYCNLLGNFEVECENESTRKFIVDFLENVRVNDLFKGITNFNKQMVDTYLIKGSSWCEEIISETNSGVERINVIPIEYLRFIKNDVTGEYEFGYVDNTAIQTQRILNQELIYYMANDVRNGKMYGYSLFDSVPFVSQIYFRILQSIQNSVFRMGDPSFWIEFDVDKEARLTEGDIEEVADGAEAAMKNLFQQRYAGQVADVSVPVPPGVKISIKTIGSDAVLMDLEIPIKTIHSQIESASGVPGFLIGLYTTGSTGFKISTHQADIISKRIDDIRDVLTSIIVPIVKRHLVLNKKFNIPFELGWDAVSLMDEVETARARFLDAQTKLNLVKALIELFTNNLINEDIVRQEILENGILSPETVVKLGNADLIRKLSDRSTLKQLIAISKNIKNGNGTAKVESDLVGIN